MIGFHSDFTGDVVVCAIGGGLIGLAIADYLEKKDKPDDHTPPDASGEQT